MEGIRVMFDSAGNPVLVYADGRVEEFAIPEAENEFPFVFVNKDDGTCEVVLKG